MRHRAPAPTAAAADGSDAAVRDANFYALPFASQMVVWAARKRINALCGLDAGTDDDVLRVFHMASLGELYTALLAIVDILVGAGVQTRFALHAVSCPCLAPHEAYLLNALAHLQAGSREDAALCLCEVLPPAGARLAMQHVQKVADDMSARALRFVFVDLSSVAARPDAPAAAAPGLKRVH